MEKNNNKTPLEEKFRQENVKFHAEIDAKLAEASRLLSEVIDASEKYGIPFESNITQMDDRYVPGSIKKIWSSESQLEEISFENLVEYETNIYIGGDYNGWQQSRRC